MNDDYYDSEDRTLFVGDLPEDFTASNLAVIFAPFGAISDIQVKVIRTVRQPFSYAFIQFETKTAAQAAFESLDGNLAYGIGGTQLRLGWAHRNKSLHVGNCKFNPFLKSCPYAILFDYRVRTNRVITLFLSGHSGY